jgi:hypothetical protein
MQENDQARESEQPDTPNSASPATRPQKGGEAATTRIGMEEGDNTDIPATGIDPDRQSKADPA